jgi:hypothetical protein
MNIFLPTKILMYGAINALFVVRLAIIHRIGERIMKEKLSDR